MRTPSETALVPAADPKGFYPGVLNGSARGRFYSLASPSGNVVGVVWTDDGKGFGFIPSDTTVAPESQEASRNFAVLTQVAGEQQMSARDAYDTSKRFGGYTASAESQGLLSDALDRYEELNDGVSFEPDDETSPGHDIVEDSTSVTPVDDETAPDTSSADTELPNGVTFPLPEGDFLSAAVDDSGQVVELLFTDDTGYYSRAADGTWTTSPDDASTDTLLGDRSLVDVSLEFLPVYDSARENDEVVSQDGLEQYRVDAS